jgi:hypothetical protein
MSGLTFVDIHVSICQHCYCQLLVTDDIDRSGIQAVIQLRLSCQAYAIEGVVHASFRTG